MHGAEQVTKRDLVRSFVLRALLLACRERSGRQDKQSVERLACRHDLYGSVCPPTARLSAAAPLETLSPEVFVKILLLVASATPLGPSREPMLRILLLSRTLYPTIQAVADMCVESSPGPC